MFTRNQIEEIKKKLIIFGTKDTQFPDAHKLSGDEIIAIVQDGENRKTPLSLIVELLSDISVGPNDDFINVSKDTTEIITLNTAVSKVDINNRKLGQVITFKDSASSWATYQFTGSSLDDWSTTSLWKNITGSGESGIDELKSQVETNAEDISVLSDEIERHDVSILNLSTDVSKLKDKDTETSSSLSELTTRVDTLKSQADTNTSKIASLNTKVSTNTSSINSLNTEVASLKTKNTTITNSLSALSTRVDNNASAISSLNTEVTALSDSLDAITTKVKVLTQEEYSLLDTPDPNTIYFIRG